MSDRWCECPGHQSHDFRELTDFYSMHFLPTGWRLEYIDCYLKGKFDESRRCSLHVGTLKTLRRDLEAAKIMGELCGALMHHASEYVNQNLRRYTPAQELEAEYRQKDAGEAGSHV